MINLFAQVTPNFCEVARLAMNLIVFLARPLRTFNFFFIHTIKSNP